MPHGKYVQEQHDMQDRFDAVYISIVSYAGYSQESGYYDFSAEVQTPHISWANPMEGGALKVLVIAPRQKLYDFSELSQRIEIELNLLPFWDSAHAGYDPTLPENIIEGADRETVVSRISDALRKDPEIILLAGILLDALSDKVQHQIISATAAGAGLCIVQCVNGHGPLSEWLESQTLDQEYQAIIDGLVMEGTPGWSIDGGFIASSRFKYGRIIQIVYPDSDAWTHVLLPARPSPNYSYADYTDDHLALIAKCLRWASARNSGQRIVQIAGVSPAGPDEEEIPPGFPREFLESIQDSMMGGNVRPFRFFLNEPATEKYDVRIAVRDPESGMRTLLDMDAPMYKGQQFYNFDLLVSAGEYRIDAFILNGEDVVDWYSESFTVDAWPAIEGFDYSKTYVLPNDTLELKVRIAGVLGAHRVGTVYARAVDSYGRSVASISEFVSNEGGVVNLRLNLADLLAPILKVEIFVLDGEHPKVDDSILGSMSRKVLYFPVRNVKAGWQMGLGVMAPVIGEPNAQRLLHRLYKSGINYYTNTDEPDEMLHGAVSGLAYVPELKAGFTPDGTFDIEHESAKVMQQRILNAWAGGSGRYLISAPDMYTEKEELSLAATENLAIFHKGLQSYFPELEMLNAAWERRIIHWDGVKPATRDDVRNNDLYPNWMGLRKVLDDRRSLALETVQQFVRNIDTDGRTGVIADLKVTDSLSLPFPDINSVMDGVLLPMDYRYRNLAVAQIDSFKLPGHLNGLLILDNMIVENESYQRYLPWYALFNQINDIWIKSPFLYADDVSKNTLLLPDGRLNESWRGFIRNYKRIQYGPGEVIQRSSSKYDKVGIFYSRSSHAFSTVEETFQCQVQDAEDSWYRLLTALGYHPVWLDEQTLSRKLKEIKVLVLPMSRSLSDREIDLIYDFVKKGGNIIADIAPGLYTEYGVLREYSPFASLMGLSYDSEAGYGLEYIGNKETPGLIIDMKHKPDTADQVYTVGETAVRLKNSTDTYATLVLNHSSSSEEYRNVTMNTLPPWTKDVKMFLESSSVTPGAFRNSDDGLNFHGSAGVYTLDGALFFVAAANADTKGRQDFMPKLDSEMHSYNMMTGEYISRPGKAVFALEPGEGVAISSLPYKIGDITLVVPEETPDGGRLNFQVVLDTD